MKSYNLLYRWITTPSCRLSRSGSPPCSTNSFVSSQSTTFTTTSYGAFSTRYADSENCLFHGNEVYLPFSSADTTVYGTYSQDTMAINGLAYYNFVFGLIDSMTVS